MNEKQVSKEQAEFLEWLEHPMTEQLRAWARRKREALKESWAQGSFSDGFDVAMAVKNAGATGACSAYLEVEKMDFETLSEELDDGEFIGARPEGQGGTGSSV